MSDTIIRVEGLGKKYSLKHQQEGRQYKALRDVIADGAKSLARPLLGKGRTTQHPSREDFWALKDVNFEIKQGDRVGIIGRNGAGKSTLLKVLSRIVEPTEGRISIKGRVASLLEVGTGFHPELTGRENIYLNGAILGMGKAEIKRKFDEIVDFAEVEKFLDTPVKRYSSGMYVRLAFAVAAHLEPEILIVDEVLAVGDAQFQQKCLGKMEDVGKEGRTVLFVSHNTSAIRSFCERCILLSNGTIKKDSESKIVLQSYISDRNMSSSFSRSHEKCSSEKPTLVAANLIYLDEASDDFVRIEVEIYSPKPTSVALELRLMDMLSSPIAFGAMGTLNPKEMIKLNEGVNKKNIYLPINQLALGKYFVSLDLTNPGVGYYDRQENCLTCEVNRTPARGRSRVLSQDAGCGCFELDLRTHVEQFSLC